MTDKMTPTECLRQLLDERGVGWSTATKSTRYTAWLTEHGLAQAADYGEDGGIVSVIHRCTPEQAVEATLGRGTCKNVSDFPKYQFVCSACGGRLDILDEFDNPNVQHDDGSFGPRFCPNCGAEVVE